MITDREIYKTALTVGDILGWIAQRPWRFYGLSARAREPAAQLFDTSDLMTRAGLPATTVSGGTSRITMLPAPIKAFSPTVMPHSSTAPEPIDAPRLTSVGTQAQSASVCNCPLAVARG